MLISFCRTFILFIIVVASIRIMGKRQIGQLQPAELVVTILLSEIAAAPMGDNDIPMLNTVIAILLLVGLEIIMSTVSMKSVRIRNLLQDNSLVIIRNGKIDQKQLKRLRYTIDDLLEALRQKDVFDITQVEYAIAETDGSLSVLLKSENQTITKQDMKVNTKAAVLPCVVISDGEIIRSDFKDCGMSDDKLNKILKKRNINPKKIFLMTIDKDENTVIIKKEI